MCVRGDTPGAAGLERLGSTHRSRRAQGPAAPGSRSRGVAVARSREPDTAPGLERIFRGESVDPASYYFRTVAEFEAPLGPHDWLNRALFLGEAERRREEAIVRFHRVN